MAKVKVAPEHNKLTKSMQGAADRRRRVATMLLDRVPVSEIATITGVGEQTIYKDKRHLERIWQRLLAEDYTILRYREVLALDKLEQEAIRRYTSSDVTTIPMEELRETVGPGVLAAMVSDNGKWFDRRLKIMEMRAKILGLFPRAEQVSLNQIAVEDNRQIVQVMVYPPAPNSEHGERNQKEVPYGEWITGILNPPPDDQVDSTVPYKDDQLA